ncbi:Uncharacterized protein HZ326_1693 [Fusarium oxysporum f. sp. albedinis]|nr:Uncharacterized protein HZ326_1693 [Fusarium oxysporum f. sp. albedinis]
MMESIGSGRRRNCPNKICRNCTKEASKGRTRGLWVAGGQAHPEIWVWLLPPRTCRILFLVTPASKTLTIITHNQNPNPPEESQKSPTNTLLTHQFRVVFIFDF